MIHLQSNSKLIKSSIKKYQELQIIDSEKVYNEMFNSLSKKSFYKVLSRMSESNELIRLSKGLYYIPKKTRFGLVSVNENNIIEYYANENVGIVVGYRMYNKYMLTTQISKKVEIFSNNLNQENRNVLNVHISKVDIKFDEDTKKMIELLDVLENYHKIEDLNVTNLLIYFKESIKHYNDKKMDVIIKEMKFKKSTLASLKNVLDYYCFTNNIKKYLNDLSTYKTINMGELDETTS